jgi:Protein of unknown function (DUF1236)
MKFGQSLAVSLAALLCTGSLALAQAPDKGGMGGGMGGGAPAEKMDRGGGGPGAGQDRQRSPGMSGERGGAERGMSGERGGAERGTSERGRTSEPSSRSARPETQGRERDQERAQRGGRDRDQDRAQRRDRDEDRAQRAGRDRDQDKAQRTARDKEQQRARDQERAGRSRQDREQDRAQRDRDRDQGKAAQGMRDRDGQLQQANRVQASEKQHAEVRQHLLRDRKLERTRLNVAINIGATIPRSVRLRPVSSVIVGFAPVYRGYSYVVLEDETICIVDPRTYVIVDVIPASTQRAERAGTRGHLILSAEERRLVLASVEKDRSADINVRLALGAEIPRSVEIVTFPDRVLEEVPQLRSYRYVVVEDQIVIVDPEDRQVALLLSD